jgi:hypothetical protein
MYLCCGDNTRTSNFVLTGLVTVNRYSSSVFNVSMRPKQYDTLGLPDKIMTLYVYIANLFYFLEEPITAGEVSRYDDCPRAGRSGDRIPVEARFSAPVPTGPEAHQASCTMGTGSFLGVKRPGRDADPLPPSSAEVKNRVELYLYRH